METYLHRKESIILTTIDLIDKLGIHQISTREIAKEQGITEAAIYKHYKNKNELLAGVIEYFFKFDHDLFVTAQTKHQEAKAAIEFVLNAVASYYENYPALTAIIQALDILRYDAELKYQIDLLIKARYEFIANTIKQGQNHREFHSDVNGDIISDILIGTLNGICMHWRMDDYQFPLTERVMQAVGTILHSSIE